MSIRQGARIVSVVWAARLVMAWVASRPAFSILSGGLADDRFLFEPGALGLLEVLRLRFDLLVPAASTTLGLVSVGYVVLTCVSAWALVALRNAQSSAERAPAALTRLFPRIAGLALCGLAAAALVALVGGLLLGALYRGPLRYEVGMARDLGLVAGSVLLLAFLLAVGVIHDLARAHLIVHDRAVLVSLRQALSVLRRRIGEVVGVRLAIAVAAVAVTSAAAALTSALAVERPESFRAWGALVSHQLAAWLLAGLHVTWLWLTLRVTRVDAPQASYPEARAVR